MNWFRPWSDPLRSGDGEVVWMCAVRSRHPARCCGVADLENWVQRRDEGCRSRPSHDVFGWDQTSPAVSAVNLSFASPTTSITWHTWLTHSYLDRNTQPSYKAYSINLQSSRSRTDRGWSFPLQWPFCKTSKVWRSMVLIRPNPIFSFGSAMGVWFKFLHRHSIHFLIHY